MERILEDFGVQPVLLLAQIVNFFILLFLLKKFLYKPLLKVLDERKDRIAQSLKNAEEIEQKLQKTEEEREKKLEDASKEARRIIDEAATSASQIVAQAHAKANQDIESLMQKGKESIAQERERMQQEMRNELSSIVALALEKVVGKSITSKDQKKLIDDALKQIQA